MIRYDPKKMGPLDVFPLVTINEPELMTESNSYNVF